MNLWVSRYMNRTTGKKLLHAFGEVGREDGRGTSFCGRIALGTCENRKGETYPTEKFGSQVDHCVACERTILRRRRFAAAVEPVCPVCKRPAQPNAPNIGAGWCSNPFHEAEP